MCFNARVSIITYIIGMYGTYLLYNKKNTNNENYNKIAALFFLCVIQMQLVEYILWNNQTCNDINKNITKIGIIINHLEPIILYLGFLLYQKDYLTPFINNYMIIYIIITIIYTISIFNSKCSLVTEISKPHIYWDWNYKKYYELYYSYFLLTLMILLYHITKTNKKYLFIFITIFSFSLSYLLYYDIKSVGSLWCFFAAFMPYIGLLIG